MKLRIRTAAALVALPLVLGACGGGDQGGNTAAPSNAASSAASAGQNDPFSAQAGAEVDSKVFLESLQKAMQAKKTYAMTMTMATGGQTIKLSGVGDASQADAVKVKMTMKAPSQAGAAGGDVEMIMDGTAMYMKMPGQAADKYVKISLEQLSQSGGQDISKLMNPAENLKLSQQAVKKITYVGDQDVSGTKLKHYKISIDPSKAMPTPSGGASASPSAKPSMPAELAYDVWVDDNKLMRKMTMDQSGTKLDMTIDKYGEPVSIQAPPASSVTQMPTAPPTGSQPTPTKAP